MCAYVEAGFLDGRKSNLPATRPRSTWTSKRAQNHGPISQNREYRQYRVQYLGHLGFWVHAISSADSGSTRACAATSAQRPATSERRSQLHGCWPGDASCDRPLRAQGHLGDPPSFCAGLTISKMTTLQRYGRRHGKGSKYANAAYFGEA